MFSGDVGTRRLTKRVEAQPFALEMALSLAELLGSSYATCLTRSSVALLIYLFRLSVCLFVCLSVCLFWQLLVLPCCFHAVSAIFVGPLPCKRRKGSDTWRRSWTLCAQRGALGPRFFGVMSEAAAIQRHLWA